MVCAVRSRASRLPGGCAPRRKTRNCGRVGVHLPAAGRRRAGNSVYAADWEYIGRQLAAANPVACPEETTLPQ